MGTAVALGSTQTDLCLVAALLDYLDKQGGAPGALFRTTDVAPLHRQTFVRAVHVALNTVGMDEACSMGTVPISGQQPLLALPG